MRKRTRIKISKLMSQMTKMFKIKSPIILFPIIVLFIITPVTVRGADESSPLATCGGTLECCCEENENGTCPSQCINQGDSESGLGTNVIQHENSVNGEMLRLIQALPCIKGFQCPSNNNTDTARCVGYTCQIGLSQSQYQSSLVDPIQSLKQVSIYICGHFKNGTAEWCW